MKIFWPLHVRSICDKLNLANDRFIKIWKADEEKSEWKLTSDYKVHIYGVNQVKWNNDGNMLASAGNDCSVNIIDVNENRLIRNFRIESSVTCVDFNYASNLILLGTFDNQIILFDMRSKTLISQILAHSEPITSVSFSQDSTVLTSSSYDGFCRIWDTFKGSCLKTIVLEKSPPINNVSFLDNQNYLLISTLNNQIQVMDLTKEQEIIKYTGHLNSQHLVDQCLIEDSRNGSIYLISGSEDGSIYKWNVEEGGEGSRIDVISNFSDYPLAEQVVVNCVASNKKGVLVSAGYPNTDNNINFYSLIDNID